MSSSIVKQFENIQNNNQGIDLMGKNLYITQFDSDIAWFSILGGKSKYKNPSTPFSTSMEEADQYGQKITKLAQEKGGLISSLDFKKTSYPIIGYVIFTVRFLSQPKVNYINKITRHDFINLLKNESDADVTSYVPDWISDKRRYIFHKNAYQKLQLIHIKLIRTTSIDDHIAFCLFNTLSATDKLNLEHIQLIKELISNGNGKSFPLKPSLIESNMRDPFIDQYLQLKTLYLQNKFKNINL